MINSNAKEMRPGENIEQYLSDDIYIEVKYHVAIKGYKTILSILFNECFGEIISIGFADLNNKNQDFLNEDYFNENSEYLKLKFKALNLDEYNKISQQYNHLYNLKKYSPFFLIFEKLQRHVFMLLENLSLDSLI